VGESVGRKLVIKPEGYKSLGNTDNKEEIVELSDNEYVSE